MAKNTFEGLTGKSSDFLQVLLALEQKTMRDTHVATLAIVKKIENNVYYCSPFPLLNSEQEKLISCKVCDGISLQVDDVVLVIFLDRPSNKACTRLYNSQTPGKLDDSIELHSEQNGIIINKVVV